MWHLWEELCPIIAHHSVQGWPPPPPFVFPWILLVDVFVFYCRYWLWDLSLTVLCFWLFCLTKSRKNKRNWWTLSKISMKRKKEECAATCPCSRCLTEMTSDHILWGFFWLKIFQQYRTSQRCSKAFNFYILERLAEGNRRWKCDNIIYCRRIVLPSEQGQTNKPSILNRCYFGVETEMKDEETVILNKHPEQNLLVFHV